MATQEYLLVGIGQQQHFWDTSCDKICRVDINILLSNNSLTEVPVEVFSLNIVALNLDGNKLRGLPDRIGEMKTLRWLRVMNNNITIVTNAIGQLTNLYSIDLRNNNIHQIHDSAVAKLKCYTYIYVHNNPLCSNGWLDEASIAKEIIDESGGREAGCKPQCSLFCQNKVLHQSGESFVKRECKLRNAVLMEAGAGHERGVINVLFFLHT